MQKQRIRKFVKYNKVKRENEIDESQHEKGFLKERRENSTGWDGWEVKEKI